MTPFPPPTKQGSSTKQTRLRTECQQRENKKTRYKIVAFMEKAVISLTHMVGEDQII